MPDEKLNAELYLMLGRLEGKLDSVIQANASHVTKIDEHDKRLVDAEGRLVQLETRYSEGKAHKSFLLSIGAVLISAGSTFWKILTGR